MPTIIITVDKDCCRCSSKILNVLTCMQDRREFCIEKIVCEKEKVIVSGTFDADKLICKLRCKAHKIIKDIVIEKPKEKEQDKIKPDKKEPKPKCEPKVLMLYPYAYPHLFPKYPTWSCSCSIPDNNCRCKPPSPPPPPPPPPPPRPCDCPTWSPCHCGSKPHGPRPMFYPPVAPWGDCKIICEENPSHACSIM